MSPQEHSVLEDLFGSGVTEIIEAGTRLVVLPSVSLPAGCKPDSAMGIFVPQQYLGYTTRLFLDSPVTLKSGMQPATTTAVLLGRTMYAASINQVPADLPLHQGILAHLRRYEYPN